MGTSAPTGRGVATVALDASVLINFLILNRMGILSDLPGYRFVVLDAVEQEVRRPQQQLTLTRAFEQGFVDHAGAANPGELEVFADHRRVMDLGEAACLAAAEVRGWMLASDERRLFRTIALGRIGEDRILTTPAILVLAVKAGVIAVEELRESKEELERNRFRAPLEAFEGLVSS